MTKGEEADKATASRASLEEELAALKKEKEGESAKAATLASRVADLEKKEAEETTDKEELEAQLTKLAFDNAEYEKHVRNLDVKNAALTRLVEVAKGKEPTSVAPKVAPSAKKPPLIRRSPRTPKGVADPGEK